MKKITSVIAAAAILGSCSSDDSSNAQTDALHALLNGTWNSACISLITEFVVASNIFNNGAGELTFTSYSDSACTNTISIQVDTYSYVFGNEITLDGSVAGLTSATQVDATDTTPGSTTLGETTYDIFAVKDLITLYLGDTDGANNGSTPALRPIQLNGLVPFTKQ